MANLQAVLDEMFAEAEKSLEVRSITGVIADRIEFVATCLANRAGVRLIMSCMLAKIDNPAVDPREPVKKIGSETCFSGRKYDERYLTDFITKNRLRCNNTTAFLTPAFRNFTKPFLLGSVPAGRPPELYTDVFKLLDDVAMDRATARNVFIDTLRHLIAMRNEQVQRMKSLLGSLNRANGMPVSPSEEIVNLLDQHLSCKNSARLPVLRIAAAYDAVSKLIGEKTLPLKSHNSADVQAVG
jgi:hypothetical protein